MRKRKLGGSDLEVTEICLGSMTWGNRNSEAEGHAQIDRALAAGVNFIDTAEMYPVNPVRAETVGHTEAIIGSWFARSGRRDEVVLASKIAGPNGGFVRGGSGIDTAGIRAALESSLRRLQTEVIDIYQLHWPNRGSYAFRQNWSYDPVAQDRAEVAAHMEEVVTELGRQIAAGKIRHWGLSNESAWGLTAWARTADRLGVARPVSVQNEYSLLCRLFDTDAAEAAHHEGIGLMAYSPLAAGILGGQYRGGTVPPLSRAVNTPDLGGRMTAKAAEAVETYAAIAARHGLSLPQMALAWALERPFMGSVIIGATTMEQLEEDLGAIEVTLNEDIRAEIQAAYKANPLPY